MTSQPLPSLTARATAALLLDAGCVSVRTDEPFRLPSGWASPVYMDCRRVISFVSLRRDLVAHAIEKLRTSGCLNGVGSVAGGEASGIALAAWIADRLNLPMQYVRKRSLGANQVEGFVPQGSKSLLIDDMMAAGNSKVGFISALRAVGAIVEDIFVVFDYGTYPTTQLLAPFAVKVHALATWYDILAVARERGDFESNVQRELQEFLDDPAAWSQARGGRGSGAPIRNVFKESI